MDSSLLEAAAIDLAESGRVPDAVLRLDQGCIAESGDLELARRIARTGYAHAAQAVGA